MQFSIQNCFVSSWQFTIPHQAYAEKFGFPSTSIIWYAYSWIGQDLKQAMTGKK